MALRELQETKRALGKLTQQVRFRIPEEDMAEVEVELETGDYANLRGAYKGVLLKRKLALEHKVGDRGDNGGDPEPEPKPKPEPTATRREPGAASVRTYVRPVPIKEALARGFVKASQFNAIMTKADADDATPEDIKLAQETLKRERGGTLEVRPD